MKFMKSVITCLLAFVAGLSVAAKPISIKGKFTKTETGYATIYLYKYLGNAVYLFDSTKYTNGTFEFKYNDVIPTGFYKIGFDKTEAMTIVAGYESIVITGNPDVERSLVITGSKENDLFREYQKINKIQNAQNASLNQQAQQLQQKPGMTEELFNIEIAGLRKISDSLNTAYSAQMTKLATAHTGLFMTKVLNMFLFDDKTAENFFSPAEFTDKEYAAGDMLPSKVQVYFQYYVTQDLYSWKAAAEKLLNNCAPGSDNKQVFYASIIPLFIQNDLDYAKELTNAFLKEYPKSAEAKQIKTSLPKGSFTTGDEVPDIILTDINGKTLSLSSLKGKVVLIDFWASWCGPCRGENPNVVSAYNKYKEKGFTVFSVSLDTNKDQWRAAINKDGLIWPNHVSDLKGWSSDPAKLYNVKGIPATFLIDQQGRLIAMNLRGEDLQAKLAELLNKP